MCAQGVRVGDEESGEKHRDLNMAVRINRLNNSAMKILVVDDVEDNVELINQILEEEHTLISAYSGEECIEKANSEHPNLILLDVNMPEMDGYETMLRLMQGENTCDIPVIFASAYYTDTSMVVKGLELGAFDYLIKPIDEDILLAKVRVVKRLKQAEEMLNRSQKMEALGKLTGGIAHDYNNILGVILGYSNLLETALDGQPKLANYSQQVILAAERGAKLTQKLLAFTREHDTRAKSLNINFHLQNRQHLLENFVAVGAELKFDLIEDVWPVYLDDNDLEDAILNMSTNSIQAMEAGGQIIYETRNFDVNEIDARNLQIKEGDYVMLCITDTGGGISDEVLEKIFDPFYTTKGTNGKGLGLTQVYGFVERSGGAIKVESTPESGTKMRLFFPRYYDDRAEVSVLNPNQLDNQDGVKTILVVDDEPGLLNLSTEVLSQKGYHILSAGNALEALKWFETESIDVLFSDVIMPDMDGYQLAAIVQEKYPNTKIQLASGYNDNKHLNVVDRSLYQNLLPKPYTIDVMLQRIRELLG